MDATGLCNLALAHLGKGRIGVFSEKSPLAETCREFFNPALEATLRTADWPFARTSAKLVEWADAEPFPGWSYAFRYPQGCAKFRRIYSRKGAPEIKHYIMSHPSQDALMICCNIPNPTGIWTKMVNPQVFDGEFRDTLAWALAYNMAMPLTKSDSLMKTCFQMFRTLGDKAAADALNEGDQEQHIVDAMPDEIQARMDGGVGGSCEEWPR